MCSTCAIITSDLYDSLSLVLLATHYMRLINDMLPAHSTIGRVPCVTYTSSRTPASACVASTLLMLRLLHKSINVRLEHVFRYRLGQQISRILFRWHSVKQNSSFRGLFVHVHVLCFHVL